MSTRSVLDMRAKSKLKAIVHRSPALGRLARTVPRRSPIDDSAGYWQARYRDGGTSGSGSGGRLARFKADVVNDLVRRHGITTVLELGCGDGRQLDLADYPAYLGVDVAEPAVEECRRRFAGNPAKRFVRLDELPAGTRADLVLSLDVVYHLVEDEVFEGHLRLAFSTAERLVVLYTSPGPWVGDVRPAPHVRHRDVRREVRRLAPGWHLVEHRPNAYPYVADDDETSFAEFFVYARDLAATPGRTSGDGGDAGR